MIKLFKNTLVVLLGLITSATSCNKRKNTNISKGKTVIVVGAGISGLKTAKDLQSKGFTVIVLEAQEKVGGRLRTDRSLGVAFDEGASWIHKPKGNPITDLVSTSGAKTFLTDDSNVKVYDINGSEYKSTLLTNEENSFNSAVENVENSGNKTQSFETVFNTLYPSKVDDRLWDYMLSAYLEFSTGGDISKLSSLYFYDDKEYKGDDIIVTNGYDKVADYLAEGLNIHLNTRVSAIDYSNDMVKVTSDNGTFEGDYVVVTVPLGVLKKKVISFTPALSYSKLEAIANTNMGNVNKFLFVWDTPFWNTNLQYIGYTPEEKGKFNYFLNINKFTNANGLMTFAFGDYATETESMTDNEIINKVMAHLKKIYGNNIPEPTQFLRTKWGENINSYGAYSYATNGTTSADFKTMATSVDDKLFFAGEHTSRSYRGTVHGAYLSGQREARKIIDLQ